MADEKDLKFKVDVDVDDPNNLITLKSGWKTTEFWIALVMLLIGVGLIAKGEGPPTNDLLQALGTALVSTSGLGYTAARTALKRPARVG
jgi:hypothetical protein